MGLNVIAFPFAGGNKYAFDFLKPGLHASDVSLQVLEYPGRGARMNKYLLDDIDKVVEDAYEQLLNKINIDSYIIYGHSMGALVAYLVCQKLMISQNKMPMKLVVSGSSAPSARKVENIWNLPSDSFWEKINEFGGLPNNLLKNHDLKIFFEPILKADFKAIEEYKFCKAEKLNIPIDVLYGTDEDISYEEVLPWKLESSNKVSIRELPGDHFFIYKHTEILNALLVNQCSEKFDISK